MELDWITPLQAAEKWGIKDRRVQAMCANGDIEGVVKFGRVWLIPKNAQKPKDGRINNRRVVAKSKITDGES
ncbi:MAG: helix-turn-helix domain-containing protein [Oscillospiraceae bacterium]|nr:helix-turn-helix domain-containing protein [Oscillospiraceae bacterium]